MRNEFTKLLDKQHETQSELFKSHEEAISQIICASTKKTTQLSKIERNDNFIKIRYLIVRKFHSFVIFSENRKTLFQ